MLDSEAQLFDFCLIVLVYWHFPSQLPYIVSMVLHVYEFKH